MGIRNVVARFDGIIAYKNGTSKPFGASYDGRYHSKVRDSKATMTSDVYLIVDNILDGARLEGIRIANKNISSMTLNFSVTVSYEDGSTGNAAIIDDGKGPYLVGSKQAFADILFLSYMHDLNLVLRNATGNIASLRYNLPTNRSSIFYAQDGDTSPKLYCLYIKSKIYLPDLGWQYMMVNTGRTAPYGEIGRKLLEEAVPQEREKLGAPADAPYSITPCQAPDDAGADAPCFGCDTAYGVDGGGDTEPPKVWMYTEIPATKDLGNGLEFDYGSSPEEAKEKAALALEKWKEQACGGKAKTGAPCSFGSKGKNYSGTITDQDDDTYTVDIELVDGHPYTGPNPLQLPKEDIEINGGPDSDGDGVPDDSECELDICSVSYKLLYKDGQPANSNPPVIPGDLDGDGEPDLFEDQYLFEDQSIRLINAQAKKKKRQVGNKPPEKKPKKEPKGVGIGTPIHPPVSPGDPTYPPSGTPPKTTPTQPGQPKGWLYAACICYACDCYDENITEQAQIIIPRRK